MPTQTSEYTPSAWREVDRFDGQQGTTITTTHCKASATCGELMQGAIDGQDFLVNCPIDLYSHACLQRTFGSGVSLTDPQTYSKVSDALNILQNQLGTAGYTLSLQSDIPRAKGMASSSADLSAALGALIRAHELAMDPCELSLLMAQIELSDNVHVPGIVHVNHLSGEIFDSFPTPDNLSVLIVDCGGEIDTLEFDRDQARTIYKKHQETLLCALDQLRRGLLAGDNKAVAEAATRSALLSQLILYKPQFGKLLQYSRACGALGVNCAHSGTVLGVLYQHSDELYARLISMIDKRFGSSLNTVGNHRIVGGGCHGY